MDEAPFIIGRPMLHYEQLDSTNSSAMRLLLKSKPPEGMVITASFQKKGKGQYGRVWEAQAAKNILCSIFLYPEFLKIEDQFFLNIFASLAVQNMVARHVNKDVRIKWPNDIYIEDKKVAGILIENGIQGQKIKQTVLGIGINVNQTVFPKDLPNPTSMVLEGTVESDLFVLRDQLFECLQEYYEKLKSRKNENLFEQYNRLLYLRDQKKTFLINCKTQNATLKGIGSSGKILLAKDGETHAYDFSEAKYL